MEAMPSEAYVGGGSLPGNKIDSWALVIRPASDKLSVDDLAKRMRTAHPAVVGRIYRGDLYIDLRGVDPQDDQSLRSVLYDCTKQSVT